VPEFCRHNRFLDRCPICSRTLPEHAPRERAASGGAGARARAPKAGAARRRSSRGESVRIQRQERSADYGYRSELVPGMHASADAERLVEEIAFSSGRLLLLGSEPPDLYAEARGLAERDPEQASWICFLIAYLCPLEGADPFAGIREALATDRQALQDLSGIALGPRSSHDPARGAETLNAYRNWAEQSSSQQLALIGEPSWSPQRRFERLFERLALPGFSRAARYELLVMLGALGLYQLQADSLYFSGARGQSSTDPATLAAKRVFAIGDPLLLDRRSSALAEALSVPVAALEPALASWGTGERATLGVAPDTSDREALRRGRDVLGL
jgi:hypothetical protein